MALATKKPKRSVSSSPHHKRRQGEHHKRNEHYMQTYWPYLPIAAIVTVGVVFSNFLGHVHKSVLGYATSMSSSQLLAGTNTQRTNNGLAGLTINSQLSSAAQSKANDMVARDYWAHNTPDGATPWTFFSAAGYSYQTAGENLAYGFDSDSAAITAWMNSPEHRDNILNNTYVDVGFGIANSPDYQGTGPETIVVAEYGSPQPGSATVAAQTPVATPAAKQPTPSPAASETPAPVATTTGTKLPETNTTLANTSTKPVVVTSKNVSRVQLLSGNGASWSMFAISTIAVVSLFVFFLKHGLYWHRALVKGEAFVIHHKLLDIALVGVGVVGFVLSRSAGLIY